MSRSDAVQAFGALASEVRLAVYQLLVREGGDGMVAGAIATALDVRPNGLSFHLKELTRAGLITMQHEGRFLRYRANPSRAAELIECLVERGGAVSGTDTPLQLGRSGDSPADPTA